MKRCLRKRGREQEPQHPADGEAGNPYHAPAGEQPCRGRDPDAPRRRQVEHLPSVADSELGQDPVYRYLSPKSWNPSGRTVGPR